MNKTYLKMAVSICIGLILGLFIGRSFFAGGSSDESKMTYAIYSGGKILKGQQVLEKIQGDVDQQNRNIYEMKKRAALDVLTQNLLQEEAEKQNLTAEKLKEKILNDTKNNQVTQAEVDQFLASRNIDPKKLSKKELDSIPHNLRIQKSIEAQKKFTADLLEKAQVKWKIPRPANTKVSIGKGSLERWGSWSAPITMTVYSNLSCPFCSLGQQRLTELKNKYKEKLKIYYRFYMQEPEDSIVYKSALAAMCANDQSQFWPFHDLMLQKPPADEAGILAVAEELKLNTSQLEECLKSGKHKTHLQADINEALKHGIVMTPSFIINDQLLLGTPSVEILSEIIDSEL